MYAWYIYVSVLAVLLTAALVAWAVRWPAGFRKFWKHHYGHVLGTTLAVCVIAGGLVAAYHGMAMDSPNDEGFLWAIGGLLVSQFGGLAILSVTFPERDN